MNQDREALPWNATRGERWAAHLEGMEATLLPVDAPLLRALRLDAPYRIAEVGSGGGGTTLEILRAAPAGSRIHAFDISRRLVERARTRTPPGDPRIAFEVADMTAATPLEPYDRLASRFGVMFFVEPQAAFANLARWLAPGGRFAFAVWGPAAENPWMTTVRDAVARVAALPSTGEDAPGPFRYANTAALLTLLDRAGFDELHVETWRGPLPIGGRLPPEVAADFALAAFSTFGDALAEAGETALAEARRDLATRFAPHHHDGAVRMDACVRIVTGGRARARTPRPRADRQPDPSGAHGAP